MKNSNWKDNAELIGIAAIVASLIFVGLQLRQDRKIAVASVQAAFVESFVAIYSDINQNAEIWDTGLAGGELSSADAIVFRNLAASLRRQTAIHSDQLKRLGRGGDIPTFILADLIRQHPGLEQEMAREDARFQAIFVAASTPLRAGSYADQLQESIERLNRLDPSTDSL